MRGSLPRITRPEERNAPEPGPPSAVPPPPRHRGRRVRQLRATLASPGKTDQIEFVSTQTQGGYKFDYYRNLAYPCCDQRLPDVRDRHQGRLGRQRDARRSGCACAAAGSAGSTRTATRSRRPASSRRRPPPSRSGFINNNGLTGSGPLRRPRASASSRCRTCNHDIYAGGDQPDPYNPNTTPDGKPRTMNGMFATKAAIAVRQAALPDRQGDPPRDERRARRASSTWPGRSRARACRRRPRSRTRVR